MPSPSRERAATSSKSFAASERRAARSMSVPAPLVHSYSAHDGSVKRGRTRTSAMRTEGLTMAGCHRRLTTVEGSSPSGISNWGPCGVWCPSRMLPSRNMAIREASPLGQPRWIGERPVRLGSILCRHTTAVDRQDQDTHAARPRPGWRSTDVPGNRGVASRNTLRLASEVAIQDNPDKQGSGDARQRLDGISARNCHLGTKILLLVDDDGFGKSKSRSHRPVASAGHRSQGAERTVADEEPGWQLDHDPFADNQSGDRVVG